MAKRIPWDKYETALLVDACAKIMAGEESRKDAITRVSTALRKRAVDNGIEIDDIFRNESGITLQLVNLQQLMKNLPDFPTRNNSKLFKDMVQMYNTDREQFNEILAVVKGNEQQMDVKCYTFREWLSNTTDDHITMVSEQAICDTEAYAIKKGIIQKSIQEIETHSLISQLAEIIKNDKLFRLFHGRQAQGIDQVLHLYAEYMKNGKSSTLLKSNIEPQNVYTISDEKSEESEEGKTLKPDNNSNDRESQARGAYENKDLPLHEGENAVQGQIISGLKESTVPETDATLFNNLESEESEKTESDEESSELSADFENTSSERENVFADSELIENETDLGSPAIEGDIKEPGRGSDKELRYNNEIAFSAWLREKNHAGSLISLRIHCIKRLSELAAEFGVSNRPFLEVSDPEEIEQEWRLLNQIPAFKSWINSHRGKYKNSMGEYLLFLKERQNADSIVEKNEAVISDSSGNFIRQRVANEVGESTSANTENDEKEKCYELSEKKALENEVAFTEWLRNEELTFITPHKRIDAIKRLSDLSQEYDSTARPFFEILNYKEMEQEWKRLAQIPAIKNWLSNRGGIYRISMNYYLRFLKEQNKTEEDITGNLATTPVIPAVEKNTVTPELCSTLTEFTDIRDPLLTKLSEQNLEYYDFRAKDGYLWVVGDLDLTEYMVSLNKAFRITFRFKPGGGNATSGRDAWLTKDQISLTEEKNSEPPERFLTTQSGQIGEEKKIEGTKQESGKNNIAAKRAAAELLLFSDWLKKQSITGKMRESIIAAVSRIDILSQKAGFMEESVYSITEHNLLEELWSKLCSDSDFEQYQQQNRIAQFAFNKYVEYRWENNRNNDTEIVLKEEPIVHSPSEVKKDTSDKDENNKELFWSWLRNSQGLAEMTCNGLVSAVSRTSQFGIKNSLIQKSLFTVCSEEELRTLWTRVQKNQHFASFDRQNGHRFSRAMGRYLAFWGEQETADDEKSKEDNNKYVPVEEKTINDHIASTVLLNAAKTDFIKWLIDNGGATSAPWTVPRALDKVDELAVKRKYVTGSLYEITDPKQLDSIRERIEHDPGYETLTERDSTVNYALRSYCDYRKSSTHQQVELSERETDQQQRRILTQSEKTQRTLFEDWLLQSGTPTGSIRTYADAIERIGNYFLGNQCENHLYIITDANELDKLRSRLAEDKTYTSNVPNANHHLDLYAFRKYISFRKSALSNDESDQIKERFSAVLLHNFENGFRLNSMIDKNRLKQYYQDQFGEELTLDDETIVKTLKTIGIEQDDRIFGRETVAESDLLNELQNEIIQAFQTGASCVYVTALYDRFQDSLASQLHIYNAEVMKEQIIKNAAGALSATKNYFYSSTTEPNTDKDILRTMRQSTIPLNYDQIQDKIWYIPLDLIKRSLVSNPDIVNVAQETYFYAGNLPVSPLELNQLAGIIHEELLQRSFLTDTQLREIIGKHCPSIAINTQDFSTWGLRNALAVLMKSHFSFRGPIISELGKEINTYDAFKEFCQAQVTLTLDELKDFAKEISGNVIYWDAVYEVMVRISQDDFVQKNQVCFDVETTDRILDELIENDYLAIKDFSLFLYFPVTGIKWNNYVLESYIGQYSQDFRLLHASYTATGTFGAIARRNSSITDFGKLVTDVLSKSDSWGDADEALNYLVNKGYLQRRRLAEIESIVSEARLLRESRRTDQ